MIKINSDSGLQTVVPPEEKPCYLQIAECITTIWQTICNWICGTRLADVNRNDISCTSPDAFAKIMGYLLSEEVGKCETVCKAWKVSDRVWKAQCNQEHVSYELEEGKHKKAFSHPRAPVLAFGVNAWKKYFGDPGVAPRLPSKIHRTFFKLQRTHTLTLVPKTVNGKPLCLNTFIPLAVKQNVQYSYQKAINEKWGKVSQEKSIWVWMEKKVLPKSLGVTQKEARKSPKLGRALWITVSIVAHRVRFKELLFSEYSTRAVEFGRDGQRPWCVVVWSDLAENRVCLSQNTGDSDPDIGVARCYPV